MTEKDPFRYEPYGKLNAALDALGRNDLAVWGDTPVEKAMDNLFSIVAELASRAVRSESKK